MAIFETEAMISQQVLGLSPETTKCHLTDHTYWL